jgi:hypothetical protein
VTTPRKPGPYDDLIECLERMRAELDSPDEQVSTHRARQIALAMRATIGVLQGRSPLPMPKPVDSTEPFVMSPVKWYSLGLAIGLMLGAMVSALVLA